MRRLSLVLVVALLTVAPGFGQEKPTRAKGAELLNELWGNLLRRDFEKCFPLVHAPGVPVDQVRKELASLIEDRHLSAKGIAALARDGQFDRLDKLFAPALVESMTQDGKIPLDKCYGLAISGAGAGFYWDGKQLKIIRCVEIGLLE